MLQQENLRLVNLVEDLGQLARADAAHAFLERQAVDLIECLREILTLYRMNFDEKQIHIETQLPEHLIVQADRDKLLQAIRNLVENCWKYTPAGGSVEITCTADKQVAHVAFVNSGTGIAEKDIPFIFERFFTADPSRSRDAGGAGIGLAIVKQLIEAHGGKVGAQSSLGETFVWFELPL
jgi:signal transduction histidine kinase